MRPSARGGVSNRPSHPAPVRSPELCVVVVFGPLRDRAAGCLESLLVQDDVEETEIVLVDLRSDLGPLPGAGHPAVVTLRMPSDTSFVAAHAEGRAAVASKMHNASAGVGAADVNGVMNYGLFGPLLRRGKGTMAPPFHTSFARAALLDLGDALEPAAFSDICFWDEVRRRGGRPLKDPASRLAHVNETTLWAPLVAGFHLHRFWVGFRTTHERWSRVRTLAAIVLVPAYPACFLWLY